MTVSQVRSDDARLEAARLAYALLRVEEPMASLLGDDTPPGHPVLGQDAYVFTPSWQVIPRTEIVPFLAALPSPALLSPTTTRGMIVLTLVDELRGDRRRCAEQALANFAHGLDRLADQLELPANAGILLEVDDAREIYSLAAVRLWTQQFGVQVGWSLSRVTGDPRVQAQLTVRRSDGRWFRPAGCQARGAAT